MAELAPSLISAASGLVGTGVGAIVSYLVGRQSSEAAVLQQREERADQRANEEEVRLRAACAQLLATGRGYSHALEVYRAGYDDDEGYERLSDAYVRFAAALADVEVIAPGQLTHLGQKWAEYLEKATRWTEPFQMQLHAENEFLEAVRLRFGFRGTTPPGPHRPLGRPHPGPVD